MINIWNNYNWQPMLLQEVEEPFDSKDYIFELKFDGIRAIVFASPTKVKIQSRNKKDITYLFPELQNIKNLVKENIIFDGEIVAFEENTYSFTQLQKRMHLKNDTKIKQAVKDNPVTFIAFDILYKTKPLLELSLLERKKQLAKFKSNDFFHIIETIDTKGITLFKKVKKLHLEGIVAKRKNGKYYINERTDNFIKIKNIRRDKFYICGYEKKKNNTLSVALGERKNKKLHFVGHATLGVKNPLYNKVKNSNESKNELINFDEKITFITPIPCYVKYLERTENNHLRHPSIQDI